MATSTAAPQGTRALREGLGAFWSDLLLQLSNFWFGMVLLATWGVMTLIGVIVDQGKDPSFYQSEYAPALARLVLRLHLDNIYHSTGYIVMIGLIVACMTLATFKRVIPARLPPLHPVKIDKIPLHASITIEGDEESVRGRVEHFFAERGWLVRKREFDGVEWTFADRHNWARRGVLVAHLGFVLIAAGTTLYWATGYSGSMAVMTGSTAIIPQNGTHLQLDRFAYKFQPIRTRGGLIYQPIDYVSDLHVTGRDGVTRAQVLRVNAPLDVDGTLYYQASYGFAVPIAVTKDGKTLAGVPTAPLEEGDGFTLGQSSRSIRYTKFVGTIDSHGGIGADPRPNNPGVVLNIFDGDVELGELLVPIGQRLDLGSGYRLDVGPYKIYSGIEYRHDPGIPLVALGAFVLLAGLCISFYFLPARLYVRIDKAAQGVVVGLAATTVKGFEIFEEQFDGLVEALRHEPA